MWETGESSIGQDGKCRNKSGRRMGEGERDGIKMERNTLPAVVMGQHIIAIFKPTYPACNHPHQPPWR